MSVKHRKKGKFYKKKVSREKMSEIFREENYPHFQFRLSKEAGEWVKLMGGSVWIKNMVLRLFERFQAREIIKQRQEEFTYKVE